MRCSSRHSAQIKTDWFILLLQDRGSPCCRPSLQPPFSLASGSEERRREWPPRWDPAKGDSVFRAEEPIEPVYASQVLPESLLASLTPFDEASKMCVLETMRFAQLTDHEYHTLVSAQPEWRWQTG